MVFMRLLQLFGYAIIIVIAAIVLIILIAFFRELWKAFFKKNKK